MDDDLEVPPWLRKPPYPNQLLRCKRSDPNYWSNLHEIPWVFMVSFHMDFHHWIYLLIVDPHVWYFFMDASQCFIAVCSSLMIHPNLWLVNLHLWCLNIYVWCVDVKVRCLNNLVSLFFMLESPFLMVKSWFSMVKSWFSMVKSPFWW